MGVDHLGHLDTVDRWNPVLLPCPSDPRPRVDWRRVHLSHRSQEDRCLPQNLPQRGAARTGSVTSDGNSAEPPSTAAATPASRPSTSGSNETAPAAGWSTNHTSSTRPRIPPNATTTKRSPARAQRPRPSHPPPRRPRLQQAGLRSTWTPMRTRRARRRRVAPFVRSLITEDHSRRRSTGATFGTRGRSPRPRTSRLDRADGTPPRPARLLDHWHRRELELPGGEELRFEQAVIVAGDAHRHDGRGVWTLGRITG